MVAGYPELPFSPAAPWVRLFNPALPWVRLQPDAGKALAAGSGPGRHQPPLAPPVLRSKRIFARDVPPGSLRGQRRFPRDARAAATRPGTTGPRAPGEQ